MPLAVALDEVPPARLLFDVEEEEDTALMPEVDVLLLLLLLLLVLFAPEAEFDVGADIALAKLIAPVSFCRLNWVGQACCCWCCIPFMLLIPLSAAKFAEEVLVLGPVAEGMWFMLLLLRLGIPELLAMPPLLLLLLLLGLLIVLKRVLILVHGVVRGCPRCMLLTFESGPALDLHSSREFKISCNTFKHSGSAERVSSKICPKLYMTLPAIKKVNL
mmetsp:Transcript_2970/g.5297  ORF Transcript_2970/g.5297 Transcript_2970/m.5297 type:complete len:217 (-) Transcript_2970:1432-2082(-)